MLEEKNLILPGNPRYQPKSLIPYFGYDNLYRTVAEVELANLDTLAEIGVIPKGDIKLLTPVVRDRIFDIPTTQVDKTEREITKHDIRAWIREAQNILNPRLGRWVHVPLTSYDAIDTARILQFLRAYQQSLHPSIKDVLLLMAELVEQFASQLQIGRTHKQAALPITVGFWLATILSRILYNAEKMDEHANQLVGKISGAVGAYNAQAGLGICDRCGAITYEERVLERLGLKPSRISTQILPPEPLGYFLFSCCMLSASLGQLGRDGRNLMATEIAEFAESFEQGQVGSSTMAHKRNPINWENMEGQWLRTKNEFGKVMDTLISDNQRDLVGSCVARDYPIILVNLQCQLDTLLRKNKEGVPFLQRVTVNEDACQRNFDHNAHLILAEPLYIAMQMAGYEKDAHELVNRQVVPLATKSGRPLVEELEDYCIYKDAEALIAYRHIPEEVKELLHHPENYTGLAAEKAMEIACLAALSSGFEGY